LACRSAWAVAGAGSVEPRDREPDGGHRLPGVGRRGRRGFVSRPRWDGATVRRFWHSGRGFTGRTTRSGGRPPTPTNALVARFAGSGVAGCVRDLVPLSARCPTWPSPTPVAQVSFPSFTRLRREGRDVTWALSASGRARCVRGLSARPCSSARPADPFVHTVLGSKWNQAIGPAGGARPGGRSPGGHDHAGMASQVDRPGDDDGPDLRGDPRPGHPGIGGKPHPRAP